MQPILPKQQKKAKMFAKEEFIMKNTKPTDIIIPVMGPTGSGKSTFINSLVGEQRVKVGHNLDICTQRLTPVIIEAKDWLYPSQEATGQRLIIVDTPGFDDYCNDESERLKEIVTWLKKSYSKSDPNMNFAGVIFMHDISHARMVGTIQRITSVFKKLCGDIMPFVILGTTKWDLVGKKDGQDRETRLKNQYLKSNMIDPNRIQTWPIYKTRESAWQTVSKIILRHNAYNTAIPPKKFAKSSEAKQAWIKKMGLKLGDIIEDGREDDLVIPVMGPSGSGKSSFINSLFRDDFNAILTKVSDDLESCTAALQPIVVDQDSFNHKFPHLKGRRLIIVDTPGFDDTLKDDSEILELISNWLASCYSKDMKLAGIIYLHDITQMRMTGASRRNLHVFQKLCGQDAFKLIVLGTTKWRLLFDQNLGKVRQKQLEDRFWKEMIQEGAHVVPIADNLDPWKLVEEVLNPSQVAANLDTIAVQDELVELRKFMPETEAGKELKYAIDQLIVMQKKNLGIQKTEIIKLVEAAKTLKVPFSRRITRAFGL